MFNHETSGFSTKAIRTQISKTEVHEHSAPLYLTSSYAFDSAEEAEGKFAGTVDGPIYGRYNNPNYEELAEKIRRLEGAEAALATSTGMAAIFAAIAGLLSQGDHIVCAKAVFGSTHGLFSGILPRFGIKTSFVSLADPQSWEDAILPETKVFFAETPSNPGLDIADLAALSEIAKRRNLLLIVDNCFASPYLQQPIRFGADLVCHSTTKFLDGQGRTLGGLIAGRKDLMDTIQVFTRATGPTMSPFNAWIVSKSLETLAVRMERHCENARAMAAFLEVHPRIERVRYPFLASHPQNALAKTQMKHGGPMVTFDLGTRRRAMDFINGLEMVSCSANLGDTRSIVTHPATTTHAKVPQDLKDELHITEGLVRMSVGLEDIEDLKSDLSTSLAKLS